MRHIDEEAINAARDKLAEELFIKKNKAFILRCASKHSGKYVTDHDDEWSVALIAFSEAVRTYDAGKGAFLSFADMVITRRLRDHFRAELRFINEIPANPSVFEGTIEEESEDAALRAEILAQTVHVEDRSIQYEIEGAAALIMKYGFSFEELAACSPKADKTKKDCAAAIRYILGTSLVLAEMRRTRALPVKAVSLGSGVAKKILERHRKYIIASAEILNGDFPELAEYLSDIVAQR